MNIIFIFLIEHFSLFVAYYFCFIGSLFGAYFGNDLLSQRATKATAEDFKATRAALTLCGQEQTPSTIYTNKSEQNMARQMVIIDGNNSVKISPKQEKGEKNKQGNANQQQKHDSKKIPTRIKIRDGLKQVVKLQLVSMMEEQMKWVENQVHKDLLPQL